MPETRVVLSRVRVLRDDVFVLMGLARVAIAGILPAAAAVLVAVTVLVMLPLVQTVLGAEEPLRRGVGR